MPMGPRNVLGSLVAAALLAWGVLAHAPRLLLRRAIPEETRGALAVMRARLWAWREGFDVRRNVAYRSDVPGAKLDIYVPPTSEVPAPLVLYFHGGGWFEGSKELASLAAVEWARRGFAVANVGYRLTRDAPAPAAVEDARCAAAWVGRNAQALGVDTTFIVAAGLSAGGHLALMVALPAADSALDRCGPLPPLAAAVNWFGPTDLSRLDSTAARDFVRWWLGPRADSPVFVSRVSPISHVRPDGPGVWTIHGDQDALIPVAQALLLHDSLAAVGARQRLRVIANQGHGFAPYLTSALMDTLVTELRAAVRATAVPRER